MMVRKAAKDGLRAKKLFQQNDAREFVRKGKGRETQERRAGLEQGFR